MSHTRIPQPPGFAQLTKEQQLRYVQDLWDQVSEEPTEVPTPESHLDLAESRLEEYRSDPSRARSAYDILKRLDTRGR